VWEEVAMPPLVPNEGRIRSMASAVNRAHPPTRGVTADNWERHS